MQTGLLSRSHSAVPRQMSAVGDKGAVDEAQGTEKHKVSERGIAGIDMRSYQELLGGPGGNFVANELSRRSTVPEGLKEIHKKGGLDDGEGEVEPLLRLLDAVNVKRVEAHSHVLKAAKHELLQEVPELPSDTLEALLTASFVFITVPELKDIPLAVLNNLECIPQTYLRQLGQNEALFKGLPPNVKRKVWKNDQTLLRQHVEPAISHYSAEMATIQRNLDMDIQLAPWPEERRTKPKKSSPVSQKDAHPRPDRGALRRASGTIQRLVRLVGSEDAILGTVTTLCRAHFADSGSTSVCSLRSQLVMAIADNSGAANPACEKDPCFKLARILDACCQSRYVDALRAKSVNDEFDASFSRLREAKKKLAAARNVRRMIKSKQREQGKGNDENDSNNNSPKMDAMTAEYHNAINELAEKAMVTRDPPTFYLLLHEFIRRLDYVVDNNDYPSKDNHLTTLARVIWVGLSAHDLAQNNPETSEFDHSFVIRFMAKLGERMIDANDRLRMGGSTAPVDATEAEEGEVGIEDEVEDVDEQFLEQMRSSLIARKFTLTYIVSRLAAGDVTTAIPLLKAANSILASDPNTFTDEAPFAATLARRISRMVSKGKIAPKGTFWDLAVSNFLVKACAISMEVHEEVLRLIQESAAKMEASSLAMVLEDTLHATRESRQAHKRVRRDFGECTYDPDSSHRGGLHVASGGAEGEADVIPAESRGGIVTESDGVHDTYAMIASKHPSKLTEDRAPTLWQYLHDRHKTQKTQ